MGKRGSQLIAEELGFARKTLRQKDDELKKAKASLIDLEAACAHWREEVSNLEHDQNALNRGYIALMGDQYESATKAMEGER